MHIPYRSQNVANGLFGPARLSRFNASVLQIAVGRSLSGGAWSRSETDESRSETDDLAAVPFQQDQCHQRSQFVVFGHVGELFQREQAFEESRLLDQPQQRSAIGSADDVARVEQIGGDETDDRQFAERLGVLKGGVTGCRASL